MTDQITTSEAPRETAQAVCAAGLGGECTCELAGVTRPTTSTWPLRSVSLPRVAEASLVSVPALDALPVGAVIRGIPHGGVWEVVDEATDGTEVRYVGAGLKDYHTARVLLELYGPFELIWTPAATQ
jgi:hypothetical protein